MIETYENIFLNENLKPFLIMAEKESHSIPIFNLSLGCPTYVFHKLYAKANSYTHEQLASYFNMPIRYLISLIEGEISFPNDMVKIKLLVDLFLKYFPIK